MRIQNPFETKTCGREGCAKKFEPWGAKKYCSLKCAHKVHMEQIALHSNKKKEQEPPPVRRLSYSHASVQRAPIELMIRMINDILAGRAILSDRGSRFRSSPKNNNKAVGRGIRKDLHPRYDPLGGEWRK